MAATEIDTESLSFKLMCKVRISASPDSMPTNRVNLLAVSNKYGLIFAGCPQGFKVLKTSDVVKVSKDCSDLNAIADSFPFWASVDTVSPATHIGLSADDLILSVIAKRNGDMFAFMYDVRAFAQKDSKPSPFEVVRLTSRDGVGVTDLVWNPGLDFAGTFVCVTTDGAVALINISQTLNVMANLPPAAGATCCCWSPKGKQLVLGKKDGSLTQYDMNLQVKRQIVCPGALQGKQFKVLDVLWQSTYVFVATYVPIVTDPSQQPILIISNVPKTAQTPMCTSYDDVCFGSSESREQKYYFHQLTEWEILLSASATAQETGVLGKHQQDKNLWQRWNLDDTSRAELPLTDDYSDTLPVGLAVDFTSTDTISLDNGNVHPQSPIFFLLSTDGVLIPYYIINKQPGVAILNKPTTALTSQGERKPKFPDTVTTSPPPSYPPQAPTPQPAAIPQKPNPMLAGFVNTPVPANAMKPLATPSVANPGQPLFQSTPAVSHASSVFGQAMTKQPAGGLFNTGASGFSFGQGLSSATKTNIAAEGQTVKIAPTSDATVNPLQGKNFTRQAAQQTPAGTTAHVAPPGGVLKQDGKTEKQSMLPPSGNTQPATTSAANQSTAASKGAPPAYQVTAQAKVTPVANQSGAPAKVAARAGQSGAVTRVESRGKRPSSSEQDDHRPDQDEMFTRSILDEMRHFQQEIEDMKKRAAVCRVEMPNKKEVQLLCQDTQDMLAFSAEIKDNVKCMSDDVSDLKSSSIETFATLEECQSRQKLNKEPRFHKLLRSRALDPATAKKMKEIHTHYQHLGSTLSEVNTMLDNEYQKSLEKKRNRRIQTPAADALYRSVNNNRNIIINQSRELNKISAQLQSIRLHNTTSPWQHFESHIPEKSLQSGNDNKENCLNTNLSPQKSTNSPMSPQKSSQLRELLGRRRVTPVKATSPANLSLSTIVNVDELKRSMCRDESLQEVEEYHSPEIPSQSSSKSQTRSSTISTGQEQATGGSEGAGERHAVSKSADPGTNESSTNETYASSRAPLVLTDVAKSVKSNTVGFKTATSELKQPCFNMSSFPTSVQTVKPAEQLASFIPKSITGEGGFKVNQLGLVTPKPASVTSSAFTAPGNAVTIGQSKAPQAAATFGQKAGENASSGITFKVENKVSFGKLSNEALNLSTTSNSNEDKKEKDAGKTAAADDKQKEADAKPSLFDSFKPSAASPFTFGTPTGPSDGKSLFGTLNAASTETPAASSIAKTLFSSPAPSGDIKQKQSEAASGFNFSSSASASGFTFGTPSKSLFGQTEVVSMSGADEKSKDLNTNAALPVTIKPVAIEVSKPASESVASTPAVQAAFSSVSTSASTKTVSTVSSTIGVESQKSSGFQFKAEQSSASLLPASRTSQTVPGFSFTAPTAPTSDKKETSAKPPTSAGFSFTAPGLNASGFSFNRVSSSSEVKPSVTLPAAPSATQPASETTTSVVSSSSDKSDTKTEIKSSPAVSGFSFTPPVSTPSTDGVSLGTKTSTSTAGSTGAGLFGGSPSKSTAGSVFGGSSSSNTPDTTSAAFGLFGNNQKSAALESSGGLDKPTTTTASTGGLFGQTATTTASTGGLFGQTATTTASTGGLFGQTATTTASTGGLFGQTATTTASTGGLFGQTATTTASTGSVLGQTATTTASTGGLFGQTATTTASTGGLFGQTATTTASTGGLFGQTVATTASSGGLFGQTTTTASTGLFGQTTTTASNGSLFGSFQTPAPSSGLFGNSQTTGSTTGTPAPAGSSSGLAFGASTTGNQGFAKPAFGQPATSPAFGSSSSSTPTANAGGGLFGSGGSGMFGGLGGKPSAENANKNVFGATTFGSQNQSQAGSSPLFGGSGSSAFGGGGAQTSSSFGTFSAGGSVASSGFGGFQQQQPATPTQGGFGSPPAFGGSPAFGASPTFGGGGAFGSTASFNNPLGGSTFGASPSAVFGSKAGGDNGGFGGFASAGANSPTFGSLSQQPDGSTFGSMAQQGRGGADFGNLAQQGGGGGGGFGGFGSPSFGGGQAFGGSGFGASSPGQGSSFTAYR